MSNQSKNGEFSKMCEFDKTVVKYIREVNKYVREFGDNYDLLTVEEKRNLVDRVESLYDILLLTPKDITDEKLLKKVKGYIEAMRRGLRTVKYSMGWKESIIEKYDGTCRRCGWPHKGSMDICSECKNLKKKV